jgi:hypothetical protein
MTDLTNEVDSARAGTSDIPRTQYQRWIRAGDLSTRARVYAFTRDAWSRIKPAPEMSEQCMFMAEYLIECLVSNPPQGDDFVHSGFEAGYELAAWLKHLAKNAEASSIIADVARRLEAAYRAADSDTRNRIETGALEHALESRKVRAFFAGWSTDPLLAEAHGPALKWGLSHSD